MATTSALLSIQPHFQTAFDNNWREIMAQQTKHRLAGLYQMDTIAGNQKRYDQDGAQTYMPRQITSRNAISEPSDLPSFERWVRPRPYDKTTWIDEFDHIAIGSLPDPTSTIAKNHAYAFNRLRDLICIAALLGTNYTGQQGTTATALPAGNILGVTYGSGSANSGLTLTKLIAASFLMDQADVEEMDRILVYSAKQLNNLLTNVDQVNNTLYNEVAALWKGRVTEFMGFKFIRTQLLPTTTVGAYNSSIGGIRSCVAYQKDFLLLGQGENVKTRIDILAGQSHTVQVRTTELLDATRLEEAGVYQINCDESV